MSLHKTVIVLLALFLMGFVMVPLVSAEDSVNSQTTSDSTLFINWAFKNEGKTVTAAQCLEVSSPNYWVNLSNEKKQAYSEIKVNIPNFHSLNQSINEVSATASQSERSANSIIPMDTIIYVATANSATSALPGAINYWASTSNTPSAFPVTNIIAQLCRWDGTQWVITDEGTTMGYATTFAEVWKNKLLPPSGQYVTYSQHYGDFPPGAVPSVYFITRWSNQVTY